MLVSDNVFNFTWIRCGTGGDLSWFCLAGGRFIPARVHTPSNRPWAAPMIHKLTGSKATIPTAGVAGRAKETKPPSVLGANRYAASSHSLPPPVPALERCFGLAIIH